MEHKRVAAAFAVLVASIFFTACPGSTSGTIQVSINPTQVTLAFGATQKFTATVSGTSNTGVTWSLKEGSSAGTLSTEGAYTAPSAAGSYHVVATSVADSTATAAATVTVSATGG